MSAQDATAPDDLRGPGATFDGTGEKQITVTAGTDGAQFLLLAGEPINEPVVFGGPFCMNSQAEIADANQRFRSGEMGTLMPSF
jgi:quercetin 2,3-dioxygenase